MLSLIAQMICCLILAAILGFVIGWLLRGAPKEEKLAAKAGVSDSQLETKERRIRELEEENRRLFADLEACRASRPAAKPAKDDLKKIKGIGPYLEEKLNSLGIYSYLQIASLTESEAKEIEKQLEHFNDRIYRDNWIAQAKQLHKEKYGEEV